MQRPLSNAGFLQVKESANSGLQRGTTPSQDARAHDNYGVDHVPQQQQPPGFGSWSFLVNTWADAEVDFQLLQQGPDALVDDIQITSNLEYSGMQTLLDNPDTNVSNSQMRSVNQGPTLLHSFLPPSPVNNSARNNPSTQMDPGVAISQETSFSSFPAKNPPNDQLLKGMSNGPVSVQSETSNAVQLDNYVLGNSNKENIHDHLQNQTSRLVSANIGGSMPPLSFGFLNGQMYIKGQVHGGHSQLPTRSGRELGVADMQLWQQQQFLYSQQLQELHRQQQIQHLQQYSQMLSQQQQQQVLAVQNHLVGNPFMPLIFGNTMHDLSQSVASNFAPDAVSMENHAAAFLPGNLSNGNPQVAGWSLNEVMSMQGSINDASLGHGQSRSWQTMLSKGSQLDPSLYGPLMASLKDATEHNLSLYLASQTGGDTRFSLPSQLEKPIPHSIPPGSLYASDAEMDPFAISNSQNNFGQDNYLSSQQQVSVMPLSEQTVQRLVKSTQTVQQVLQPVAEPSGFVVKHQEFNSSSSIQQHFQDIHGHQQRVWRGCGQNKATDLQNISQSSNIAEALPRSCMSNHNVQQSGLSNIASTQSPRSSATSGLKINSENAGQLSSHQKADSHFAAHSMSNQQGKRSTHQSGDYLNCTLDDGQQQREHWRSLPLRQREIGNNIPAASSPKPNRWSSNCPVSSGGSPNVNGLDRSQLETSGMLYELPESATLGSSQPTNLGGNVSKLAQSLSHPYAARERQDGECKLRNGPEIGKAGWSLTNINDGSLYSSNDQLGHKLTEGGFALEKSKADAQLSGKLWTSNMQQNVSEAERCRVISASNELHNSSNQNTQPSQLARNMILMNIDTSQNCHVYSQSQQTSNFKAMKDYSRKLRSQEHGYVEHFKGEARQNSDLQVLCDQDGDIRVGLTFDQVSSNAAVASCLDDSSQIQGSTTTKADARQLVENDACEDHGKELPSSNLDYRHFSPRNYHDTDCNRPAEWRDRGKSAANPSELVESRLRQMKEVSASNISNLGDLSASHLLHFHTYKGPTSKGMPNVEVSEMRSSDGGNIGGHPSEEKLKSYSYLNALKDFTFSKSQADVPSGERNDSQLNAHAYITASITADKVEASSMNRPGHPSSLPREHSGDEQHAIQNKGRVSSPNISSSNHKHNQLPHASLPRSLGLALAPPSYSNLQQGCSGVNSSMYVRKSHNKTTSSMVAAQVHTQPNHNHHGVTVETTESHHEGNSDTNVFSIVNPNVPMLPGFKSDRTSTFDSRQPAFASQKQMQISNPDQMSTSSQNLKLLGSSQKESSIPSIHPRTLFMDKGMIEYNPVTSEDSSLVYGNCTVHQVQDTQGGAWNFISSNNLTSPLSNQNKVPAAQEKRETEPIFPSNVVKSGMVTQFQSDSQTDVRILKNRELSAVESQNQLFESCSETRVFSETCSKHPMERNEKACTSPSVYELKSSSLQPQVQEIRRPSPGRLPPSAFQSSRFSLTQVSRPLVMQEQEKGPPPPDNSVLLCASQASHLREGKTLSDEIPIYASGRVQHCQLQDAGLITARLSDYALSHKHILQQQTDTSSDGPSPSQTSENLSHSDTQGIHMSEQLDMARLKQASSRKPPKHNARMGGMSMSKMKGKLNQQNAHHTNVLSQNVTHPELRSPQEHVSLVLESQSKLLQGSQKEIDKVPYVYELPQKEALNEISNKNLEAPQGLSHGQVQHGASSISSDQEERTNGHIFAREVASFHKNIVSTGRVQVGSHSFASKNSDNFVIGSGPSQFCNGVVDIMMKEGESRLLERTTSGILDESGRQELSRPNFLAPVPDPPRKRKKVINSPIPWYITMIQAAGQILSTSGAELVWAASTNRLPEKDGEEADCPDEGVNGLARAKRRLKLTTQLLQQLIPPLPPAMMQGNNATDYESATYIIAKRALGDACQLIAKCQETNPSLLQAQKHDINFGNSSATKKSAFERFSGSFLERIKQLESELANLEGSTSTLDLKNELLAGETLSIVNRLARHHGRSFPLESLENLSVIKEFPSGSGQGIHRPLSQRYVTALPMPRTLPEGVKCLSL